MAEPIKFDLKKCNEAISSLKTAKEAISGIISGDLKRLMANVETIYDSPTENKMQETYASLEKDYIEHFDSALYDAIDYLETDVIEELVGLETAASNAIQE